MKKYLIGAIIGFMLSLGVGAHAEVVNMIGQVIDGAFNVKVNGVQLANQAIVVQGTSYLPVREFGEATGYNVGFDADLGITMTKQDVTPTATQDPSTDPAYIKGQKIVELQKQQKEISEELEVLGKPIKQHQMDLSINPDLKDDDTYLQAKKAFEDKKAELAEVDKELDALQK
jgi:hypothetical protein